VGISKMNRFKKYIRYLSQNDSQDDGLTSINEARSSAFKGDEFERLRSKITRKQVEKKFEKDQELKKLYSELESLRDTGVKSVFDMFDKTAPKMITRRMDEMIAHLERGYDLGVGELIAKGETDTDEFLASFWYAFQDHLTYQASGFGTKIMYYLGRDMRNIIDVGEVIDTTGPEKVLEKIRSRYKVLIKEIESAQIAKLEKQYAEDSAMLSKFAGEPLESTDRKAYRKAARNLGREAYLADPEGDVVKLANESEELKQLQRILVAGWIKQGAREDFMDAFDAMKSQARREKERQFGRQ
jgi:hypothetical protein